MVQSNTGKMFKVDEEDGTAKLVLLDEDLTLADGSQSGATRRSRSIWVCMMGNVERKRFSIVEVSSKKESGEEQVWVYVLIGFGFDYFLFWRFQMR